MKERRKEADLGMWKSKTPPNSHSHWAVQRTTIEVVCISDTASHFSISYIPNSNSLYRFKAIRQMSCCRTSLSCAFSSRYSLREFGSLDSILGKSTPRIWLWLASKSYKYYSWTPHNPYLLVDGPRYGLWGVMGFKRYTKTLWTWHGSDFNHLSVEMWIS